MIFDNADCEFIAARAGGGASRKAGLGGKPRSQPLVF